jgi:hypothetical protein
VRKRGEQGFTLVTVTLSAAVLVGMLGLAMDVGQMFILKNELQTFVDASAMGAVSKLDGTQAGVQLANNVAIAGPLGTTKPNGYKFDSIAISNVTATYATTFTGTYDSYGTASASSTNSYRFMKVSATQNLSLNFLPTIPGISSSLPVSASAVAGQQEQNGVSNGGLVPFAPDAHNQADTKSFGFTPGSPYTLKWGNGNTTTCAGDAGFTPSGSPPSEHGFVDIGEGNGTSGIRPAIEYGGYPNSNSTPSSVAVGQNLVSDPGNRGSSIFGAINDRAAQDTDDVSATYAGYLSAGTGNGRRIVTVAVVGTWTGNGHNANAPVVGFANFFLGTSYSGSSGPICATYIGPGNLTGNGSGGTDATKVYVNNLYQ